MLNAQIDTEMRGEARLPHANLAIAPMIGLRHGDTPCDGDTIHGVVFAVSD
jgi:hypothetical protein